MSQLLFITLAGGIGALMRFWLTSAVTLMLGRDFPYGTLSVNVLGSILIGFLAVFFIDRVGISETAKFTVMIGFLGSFTTFSTFSLETIFLFERGEIWAACINVIASVVLCLVATFSGMLLARYMQI